MERRQGLAYEEMLHLKRYFCNEKFGVSCDMYALLNEYDIVPESGWTIPCGALHAPGYPTFETTAKDD